MQDYYLAVLCEVQVKFKAFKFEFIPVLDHILKGEQSIFRSKPCPGAMSQNSRLAIWQYSRIVALDVLLGLVGRFPSEYDAY